MLKHGVIPTDQAKKSPFIRGFEYGAGTTNRTRDLLITSQLLYQLSYAGKYIFNQPPGRHSRNF